MRDDRETTGPLEYTLELQETSASSGYFACEPVQDRFFSAWVDYLRHHPYDGFLRKHLLNVLKVLPEVKVKGWIQEAVPDDPVFGALLYEACLTHGKFAGLEPLFRRDDLKALADQTPLVYIRSVLRPDHGVHLRWMQLFAPNIERHQPLPPPEATGVDPPFPPDGLPSPDDAVHIRDLARPGAGSDGSEREPPAPPEMVARTALERLGGLGVLLDDEQRHTGSLAPRALIRQWKLHFSVCQGRHDLTVTGVQNSYGRGLHLEPARAACAMEVAERVSAFAGVGEEGVLDRIGPCPLIRARYEELVKDGVAALDPNRFPLEAPYEDEPLYWIEGQTAEDVPIQVPFQCVFLFSNLDEIDLFSGLGSTGLASGLTLAGARVSGLLECIERDAEGTAPFDPARCFRIESEDPEVAALLQEYRSYGIHVRFQDLTPAHGVPCYKCFVIKPGGEIAKGVGAGLDGKRALISALTETPFPFPGGPPSMVPGHDLPARKLSDLPDYSTGSSEDDLALLESLLTANGFPPLYVDITRGDLNIPAVRALVPGLALTADFDRFSRVHPRLFANYLAMFRSERNHASTT